MKLARLPHDPGKLMDFFHEGLEALGAVCERSWHDRLQLVAEGAAARLWNPEGSLLETEIHFPPVSETAPRHAEREVFPGCPLTFHLVESLRPSTLPLGRAILQSPDKAKPPAPEVAEKLWHSQMPGATRWKLETPFIAHWHFSLLVLERCEIQAIDQHWSLHRVAISLPDGQRDESLASQLDFHQLEAQTIDPVPWPSPDLKLWHQLIRDRLEGDFANDLSAIRLRQENYLRRELERIDSYFESYGRELRERLDRKRPENTRLKVEERLAAAKAEHGRRRQDQVHRHEIRVIPHLDALLLLAEPAWKTRTSFVRKNEACSAEALFVPRARRWMIAAGQKL